MSTNERQAVAEPLWIPVSKRLPKNGQSVLVKGRYDATPRQMTFRGNPAPRWEQSNIAYQFERFDYWAELPS
jgi:hypothetical protein